MSEFFPLPNELAKHSIFPGVGITTCAASQMMMSLVKMDPNSEVKSHSHPHEQVGIVLKGRAIFKIGDEKKELAAKIVDLQRDKKAASRQMDKIEKKAAKSLLGSVSTEK